MAERRMFAKTIVLSDEFLDMPLSARCLYFTLGMFADDDGFVNSPKGIMRQCGASQDDMNILLSKRFVLMFESGVIVIKHWRINNYLRNDRYQSTKYVEEKELLTINENGSYSFGIPNSGIPSIDKDSKDKNSIDKDSKGNSGDTKIWYPNDEELNSTFNEFILMRKKIKKPFATDHAIDLAMKKLQNLSGGDNDLAIEILNQSIENSWQGLFPLKEQNGKAKKEIDWGAI